MARAAIYARKSTEQNVTDDAKSVTRQVELARAFAAEKHWRVIEEYADDGISGAVSTKLVNRARMVAAAPEGKFEVLIVRDLDRLSRNDEELPGLIYTLRDAGVEVWSYADRSRVDTRTAMSRGMLTMKATFAAAEREAAQARTREAMRRKAERGEVAGGRVLGYTNVRQDGGPVLRVVNDAEACIVRRIFEMAAAGKGLLRIAKTLNTEGIKNPTGQDRGKPTKRSDQWSTTGIREVLHRELYRGRVVYGKTRWEYRRGRKFKVSVPESDWIVLDRPELQIVGDELWSAAHNRLGRSREVYLRRNSGRPTRKAPAPAYLLSGFLRCGVCGGTLVVNKTMGQRGRPGAYYQCANHRARPGSCSNKHGVPAAALHEAVLDQLRHHLAGPMIVGHLLVQIEAPAAHEQEQQALAAQVADLDRRITKLLDLYEREDVPDVAARIKDLRTQRNDVTAKLEHLQGLSLAELPDFTTPEGIAAWQASLAPILEVLRGGLGSDVEVAREHLRHLLPEPIVVTPLDADSWNVKGLVAYKGVALYFETGGKQDRDVREPVAGRVNRGSRVGKWCPRPQTRARTGVLRKLPPAEFEGYVARVRPRQR